eukprot:TRINITY_DN5016_c0_g2_i1.p1 TRINITY_DN5016_c0_g2~~TRINITY_DN5016_c0_g2_i1.p1  ORF type:complete len:417 (+),score=60.87 TRINITY_DN5016_c0_g2_i1:675-1925(+)
MLRHQFSSAPLSSPTSTLGVASFSTSALTYGSSSNGMYLSCSPTFHSPARLAYVHAKGACQDISSPKKEFTGANRALDDEFRDIASNPLGISIFTRELGEKAREPSSDHQDSSDTNSRVTTPTAASATASAPSTPLRCPRPVKAVLLSGADCGPIERDGDIDGVASIIASVTPKRNREFKADSSLEAVQEASTDRKRDLDGDLTAGLEVVRILSQPSSPALRFGGSAASRVAIPLVSPARQPSAPTMQGLVDYPRTGSTPNLHMCLSSPLKKSSHHSVQPMSQPQLNGLGHCQQSNTVNTNNQQHQPTQGPSSGPRLHSQNGSPTEVGSQNVNSQRLVDYLEYVEQPNHRIFTPPCRNLHPLSFDSRIHKSSMFNDSFLSLSPPPTSPGIDRDDDDRSDIGVMPMAVGASGFQYDY